MLELQIKRFENKESRLNFSKMANLITSLKKELPWLAEVSIHSRSIEFMKSINFLLFHEHNGISTQLTKSVTTISTKYNAYKIDVFNHNLKLCSGYILIVVEIQ